MNGNKDSTTRAGLVAVLGLLIGTLAVLEPAMLRAQQVPPGPLPESLTTRLHAKEHESVGKLVKDRLGQLVRDDNARAFGLKSAAEVPSLTVVAVLPEAFVPPERLAAKPSSLSRLVLQTGRKIVMLRTASGSLIAVAISSQDGAIRWEAFTSGRQIDQRGRALEKLGQGVCAPPRAQLLTVPGLGFEFLYCPAAGSASRVIPTADDRRYGWVAGEARLALPTLLQLVQAARTYLAGADAPG